MEQKQTIRKRKKGAWIVLFLFGAIALLLLAMFATMMIQGRILQNSRPTARPTEEPTATPEPTPLPDRNYAAENKPAFEPELDKLGMTEYEIEDYGPENLVSEYWLDITPDDLRAATGCAVIRHIGLGYSYIVWNGTYYRLGEGDDGKGVLDVILSDLNNDSVPDVLYTYHFGTSEDAQTKIGWFDFATGQSKLSPFSMRGDFLALNQEDGHYMVYRCERFVDEEYGFSLRFIERLGELIENLDELYLVME